MTEIRFKAYPIQSLNEAVMRLPAEPKKLRAAIASQLENDSHFPALKLAEYAIMGNTQTTLAFSKQTPVFLNYSLKLSTAAL